MPTDGISSCNWPAKIATACVRERTPAGFSSRSTKAPQPEATDAAGAWEVAEESPASANPAAGAAPRSILMSVERLKVSACEPRAICSNSTWRLCSTSTTRGSKDLPDCSATNLHGLPQWQRAAIPAVAGQRIQALHCGGNARADRNLDAHQAVRISRASHFSWWLRTIGARE